MKRFFIIVAVLVTLVFIIKPTEGAEKGSLSMVSIGTHPVGSFFNTVGTAAAKVISERSGIRAIP
ncbi:MAG: hypothetical protein Q8K46_02535, partial [Deltaproteobacteria bacterium]|nr:hypothetical protein [Deltaproteobacteria bacterium]